MTEPRYTSPIPPYQAPGAPHAQQPLEGVVVDGPGRARAEAPPMFGPFVVTGPGARPRAVRQKSLLLAGLLAFLLPPIGMLYGTILGAIVMTLISIPVAIVTGGQGLAGLWPLCVLWAVWGAHRTNQRRLAWAALGL